MTTLRRSEQPVVASPARQQRHASPRESAETLPAHRPREATGGDIVGAQPISAGGAEAILALQRTHGNTFVGRMLDVSATPDIASRLLRLSAIGSSDVLLRDIRADRPTQTGAGGAIPWTRFQEWAIRAIDKYEDGATEGLTDFEKDVKEPSSADWRTFALNVVGNVVWAVASFATGGTAFFISLAGIAIGAGATAAVMAESKSGFDMTRFHHHARAAMSGDGGVVEQLKGRVVAAARSMEQESAGGRWPVPNDAHRELLVRLFAGPQFIRDEAGLPTVNKWAVAKKVEAELLLATASSMPGRPSAWKHIKETQGVYLSLHYVAPDAMADTQTTKPFGQWGTRLKTAALRDDTGLFPNIAERLTAIYGQTLKERMPIGLWPFEMDIDIVVGADSPASSDPEGPPWVHLKVLPRGRGLQHHRGVGLKEVPGRTFLTKGSPGRLSEETGRLILLDALPPFDVKSLGQING